MKRFLSMLLVCTMFLSIIIYTLSFETSASLYMIGDINGDFSVNALDVMLIKKNIIEGTKIEKNGDIDGDSIITSKDVFYLKGSFVDKVNLEKINWKGFTVNSNSIDNFKVVVTNSNNKNMVFAASELVKYASYQGYNLETIYTNDIPTDNAFVITEGTEEEFGTDGFNISVNSSIVTILAAPLRGTMYGVYTIIKDYFGYNFYGYDQIELVYENTKDLTDGLSNTQIPQVRYRSNGINPFTSYDYVEKSVLPNMLSGATTCYAILNEKYGFGIMRLWANAHSFEYFISSSQTHCLSDITYDIEYDGTQEYEDEYSVSNLTKCYYNMSTLIRTRVANGERIGKEITEISCSYAADEKYCSCKACRKIYNAEGAYSAVLIRFVNMIDNLLKEEFPNIDLITNAYAANRRPPKTSNYVLNEDIILLYCWNACTNHDIGTGECSEEPVITSEYNNQLGSNYIEEQFFSGWEQHCSRFYIWYYPTNIYYLLCPQPNFYKVYNDFRWYIEHGVEGFYIAGTEGSSFENMEGYLMNNIMWNNSLTKDEFIYLMREYLRHFYGYGWTYIEEYMNMLDECGNLKGCVLNDYEQPFDIYDKEYFANNFDKMLELFNSAYEAAETDFERQNVDKLSIHMKFLGYSATYESDYVNGTTESRNIYAQGWQWVYEYINSHAIRVSYDRVGIDKEFSLDVSPMQLVYDISGSRY